MKKRLFAALLALLMLSGSLAACGDAETAETAETTDTAEEGADA